MWTRTTYCDLTGLFFYDNHFDAQSEIRFCLELGLQFSISLCANPTPGGFWCLLLSRQEASMDTDELKKILAGLAIAGLITGSTLSLSGCAAKSA
jgi:radical SAM modification target selenobiotic family peptide